MRVGALPEFPSNALNYNLTWSTDGLINEYCNPCQAIHDGRLIDALPLDGLESFSLDGVHYEAFNTSGGLGTLCETLLGQVRELNYRTIRYRGHRELMAFLLARPAAVRTARDAERHPRTRRSDHLAGRGGDLLQRHGLAGGPLHEMERRAEDLQPIDRRTHLERDPSDDRCGRVRGR